MRIDIGFSRSGYMSRCHDSCKIFGHVLRKRFDKLRSDDRLLGLSEFDADKTMRLLAKLWRQRYEELLRSGAKPTEAELENRIFAFPIEPNFNAKHGHRIAFPPAGETPYGPSRNLKPVLDVINSFDAKTPFAEKILITREIQEDWGIVKRFEPQISSVALLPLVQKGRIVSLDIQFLSRVGDASGVLDEWEIQAIGRHESADATQESLLEELERWVEYTTQALDSLQTPTSGELAHNLAISRSIWQSWSYSLECARKAGLHPPASAKTHTHYIGDRDLYDKAFQKLENELTREGFTSQDRVVNSEIIGLLKTVQPPSAKIWGDPRVSVLGFSAFCSRIFATYFCGSLKELDSFKGSSLESRLVNVSREEIEHAFHDLKRFINVPRDSRPSTFTMSWFNTIAEASDPLAEKCVPPSLLWDRSVAIESFITGARDVFEWLSQNIISPDLIAPRVQEVN